MLLAGIPTALLYFIPRAATRDERNAWIARAYLLLGATGLAAVVAVVAAREPLAAAFNNDGLATAVAWYAPYLFFAFVAAVAPPALTASDHVRSAAALNAFVGFSTMACVVVAVIVRPNGTGLAMALSASGALLALASVSVVRRVTGMRFTHARGRTEDAKRMLAYGVPLAATGLAATLGYQFDRIVVGVTFSPREFAVYALGAVEIPLGLLIAVAVGNVLVPRLTTLWRDGDRDGVIAVWREAMRKTGLVLLPLFAFAMVMSSDLVRLLYGSGYSDSVDVFRIYLFLLPLRIASWGFLPQAIGRTGINFRASIVLLGVNACIALALVGPLGLIGAALAAPVALVVTVLYYVARIRSVAGFRARDLVPARALTGTLAVSVLAAAPLLVIAEIAVPSSIRLAAAGLVFGLLSTAGLRATRMISDDDWYRLHAAARRLGARRRREPDVQ